MCHCIYCMFDIILIIPHFESFELQVIKFNYSVFQVEIQYFWHPLNKTEGTLYNLPFKVVFGIIWCYDL